MALDGRRFVWLFVGALVAVVGVTATLAPRYGRMAVAHAGARQVASALERFQADNGFYPSESQGLHALVAPPTAPPRPRAYREGGYLAEDALVDAWGRPFEYRQPGEHNPDRFDVWTWGADGEPGGTGIDADFGNFDAAMKPR